MAAVSTTTSQLHISYPARLFKTQSSLINTEKTQLGFKPRGRVQAKWETGIASSAGFGLGNRGRRRKTEGFQRGKPWVVTCTAEGIERGMLMGNRGGGSGEAAAAKKAISVPERFKVVALLACVMCLCNADRVVMSVAIVPLAAKNGWTSSFLGVVQVFLNRTYTTLSLSSSFFFFFCCCHFCSFVCVLTLKLTTKSILMYGIFNNDFFFWGQ